LFSLLSENLVQILPESGSGFVSGYANNQCRSETLLVPVLVDDGQELPGQAPGIDHQLDNLPLQPEPPHRECHLSFPKNREFHARIK
jgi:hypothetical protein